MEGRVTIIGLGCVGTSIGLALRRLDPAPQVIGHDIDSDNARQAKRVGAVDETNWNLPAACEGADLVILALPLQAVRETLQQVAPHLKEGCVVTDTAGLKLPVLEWARAYLPDTVRFVAGLPIPGPEVDEGEILVGPEVADADLFRDGVYCITPAGDTDPRAVNRLLELIKALQARPLFLDPLEHDGLQAGVADLPALIAVALLQATVDSPGWVEMRKVAGYDFAALTAPAMADPGGRFEAALLNRENLVRRLDMFLDALGRLRRWLVDADEESLKGAYESALGGRTRWVEERAEAGWGESLDLGDVPGIGEQIRRMLFGGTLRRQLHREDE